MKTIEIEIQKEIKEYRTVHLPLYRKNQCHAYKVFSQDQCILVCHALISEPEIGVRFAGLAFHLDSETCTEEEFTALYIQTLDRLNGLAR